MNDVRDSDPNFAEEDGLQGDMGISSERTGPYGDKPADAGLQGTGTHGTAATETVGVSGTTRAEVHGPEMDDTQQEATQEWRDTLGPVDDTTADDATHRNPDYDIDRTVGESNTAEVPSQDFDPSKNPGHSHG